MKGKNVEVRVPRAHRRFPQNLRNPWPALCLSVFVGEAPVWKLMNFRRIRARPSATSSFPFTQRNGVRGRPRATVFAEKDTRNYAAAIACTGNESFSTAHVAFP